MFAGFVVFGAILFLIAYVTRRQQARVLTTPRASTGDAADGRVSLQGTARAESADPAPISGRASAYWEAELWDTRWMRNRLPAARESAAARVIWLEDGTGRLPVLLHGVQWQFATEDEFSPGQTLPAGGEAFVSRHGYRWDSGKVRLRERRIEQGKPLYVLGTVAPVAEVIRAVDGLQHAAVARAVAALQPPGSHAAEPFDLAGYLRGRFRPDERIVWAERTGLLIGEGTRERMIQRLQWTISTCRTAGYVLLFLAAAQFFIGAAAE